MTVVAECVFVGHALCSLPPFASVYNPPGPQSIRSRTNLTKHNRCTTVGVHERHATGMH